MTNERTAEKAFGTVYALYKEVTGQELHMENYSSRLMLQKLVYIVQQAGKNFGYTYGWHLRGPYSVGLAADGFNFIAEKKDPAVHSLNKEEMEIASKLKKYFKEDVTTDKSLELLGALVYIRNEEKVRNPEKLLEKLRNYKPWFTEKETKEMIKKIENSTLFSA